MDGHQFLCRVSIFASFYDSFYWILKCFDSVVFIFFHFINLYCNECLELIMKLYYFFLILGGAILIGITIYVTQNFVNVTDLHFSFGVCVLAAAGSIVGGILLFCGRSRASANH